MCVIKYTNKLHIIDSYGINASVCGRSCTCNFNVDIDGFIISFGLDDNVYEPISLILSSPAYFPSEYESYILESEVY